MTKDEAKAITDEIIREWTNRTGGSYADLERVIQNKFRTALSQPDWTPIDRIPEEWKDGRKLELLFPGPFHDTIEDGIAVGRWSSNANNWWLTAIWASSHAHRPPIAARLIEPPKGPGHE